MYETVEAMGTGYAAFCGAWGAAGRCGSLLPAVTVEPPLVHARARARAAWVRSLPW